MVEFLTEDQILEDLIKDQDSRTITDNSKDDLIILHQTFGMYIRNEYHLWDANNPVTNYGTFKWNSDHHPDQISQRLIERLYEYWMNNPLESI